MATLATNVSFQCFGLDGKPLAGGKVYTYSAGTTTSKATYTTMAGTVANPNPVILDQSGKAKIFLSDGSYRLQIKDSNDALIDDIDQISRYVTQSELATFQQTVNDGVTQLTEVREQIDVFMNTSISNQKGFANGVTPLDPNVKIDPIYLPPATTLEIGAVKLNNTLASTATDQALTAAQGKVLKDTLDTSFGINQSGADVTSSRLFNTTYVNSTSRSIFITVQNRPQSATQGAYMTIEVNGLVVAGMSGNTGFYTTSSMSAVVSPGSTYKIGGTNIGIQRVVEYS